MDTSPALFQGPLTLGAQGKLPLLPPLSAALLLAWPLIHSINSPSLVPTPLSQFFRKECGHETRISLLAHGLTVKLSPCPCSHSSLAGRIDACLCGHSKCNLLLRLAPVCLSILLNFICTVCNRRWVWAWSWYTWVLTEAQKSLCLWSVLSSCHFILR